MSGDIKKLLESIDSISESDRLSDKWGQPLDYGQAAAPRPESNHAQLDRNNFEKDPRWNEVNQLQNQQQFTAAKELINRIRYEHHMDEGVKWNSFHRWYDSSPKDVVKRVKQMATHVLQQIADVDPRDIGGAQKLQWLAAKKELERRGQSLPESKEDELSEGIFDRFKRKKPEMQHMTDDDLEIIKSADNHVFNPNKAHGLNEPTYNLRSMYRNSERSGGVELTYFKHPHQYFVGYQVYRKDLSSRSPANPAGLVYGPWENRSFKSPHELKQILGDIFKRADINMNESKNMNESIAWGEAANTYDQVVICMQKDGHKTYFAGLGANGNYMWSPDKAHAKDFESEHAAEGAMHQIKAHDANAYKMGLIGKTHGEKAYPLYAEPLHELEEDSSPLTWGEDNLDMDEDWSADEYNRQKMIDAPKSRQHNPVSEPGKHSFVPRSSKAHELDEEDDGQDEIIQDLSGKLQGPWPLGGDHDVEEGTMNSDPDSVIDEYYDSMPSKKASKNPRQVGESRNIKVAESSAPGQEDWIRDNKERFIKEYGKKKGLEVLYATAWKRSKKNESVSESDVDPRDPTTMKGYEHWSMPSTYDIAKGLFMKFKGKPITKQDIKNDYMGTKPNWATRMMTKPDYNGIMKAYAYYANNPGEVYDQNDDKYLQDDKQMQAFESLFAEAMEPTMTKKNKKINESIDLTNSQETKNIVDSLGSMMKLAGLQAQNTTYKPYVAESEGDVFSRMMDYFDIKAPESEEGDDEESSGADEEGSGENCDAENDGDDTSVVAISSDEDGEGHFTGLADKIKNLAAGKEPGKHFGGLADKLTALKDGEVDEEREPPNFKGIGDKLRNHFKKDESITEDTTDSLIDIHKILMSHKSELKPHDINYIKKVLTDNLMNNQKKVENLRQFAMLKGFISGGQEERNRIRGAMNNESVNEGKSWTVGVEYGPTGNDCKTFTVKAKTAEEAKKKAATKAKESGLKNIMVNAPSLKEDLSATLIMSKCEDGKSMTLTITDQQGDEIEQLLSLAGISQPQSVAVVAGPEVEMSAEGMVDEDAIYSNPDKDPTGEYGDTHYYDNMPKKNVYDLDTQINKGSDLNAPKGEYAKEFPGDNRMDTAKRDAAYESKDVAEGWMDKFKKVVGKKPSLDDATADLDRARNEKKAFSGKIGDHAQAADYEDDLTYSDEPKSWKKNESVAESKLWAEYKGIK